MKLRQRKHVKAGELFRHTADGDVYMAVGTAGTIKITGMLSSHQLPCVNLFSGRIMETNHDSEVEVLDVEDLK